MIQASFHSPNYLASNPSLKTILCDWKLTKLSQHLFKDYSKESLLKRKNEYRWPPSTNYFRSAVFNAVFFSFFCKTRYLHEEVKCIWAIPCTKGSLVTPSLSRDKKCSYVGSSCSLYYLIMGKTREKKLVLLANWAMHIRHQCGTTQV